MQEIFWFFLGGFVYLMVDKAITFYRKVKFLNDIQHLSYKLIGYAYQQWATITAAKYIYLDLSEHNAEEIKIMKNMDEADLLEWKKEAVKGLNESVPPRYRSALKIDGWNTIVDTIGSHYNGILEGDYIVNKEGNLHAED